MEKNTTDTAAVLTENTAAYQKPDPAAKKAWRLTRLITAGVFFALLIAAYWILWLMGMPKPGAYIALGILGALTLLFLVMAFAFPAIEYRQWGYRIEEDKVTIRHGIFWIHTQVIPIIRIQNVTTRQGPIDRHYGLCSVELALASGTFDIRGLKKEDADDISQKLSAHLYKRVQEKGVL